MNCIKLPLILICLLLLTACQPQLDPNSYDYYGGQGARVQEGVIQDIQDNVKVRKNNGVGGLAGGVAGGALGSNLGGGVTGLIGAVGGAVIGGIAGNAAENSLGSSNATLYIISLTKSGRLVSVIQQSKLPLCKGDHIYLISSGDRPRLSLMDSYYSDGKHQRTGCENKTS